MAYKTYFTVTKHEINYEFCNSCGGTVIKSHSNRYGNFNKGCVQCNGEGRVKITRKTEVSLIDALKELKLIKSS